MQINQLNLISIKTLVCLFLIGKVSYSETEAMTSGAVLENYTSEGNILITLIEVSPSARTYFDLQSNGSTRFIEQDPIRPLNIHACFMVSTDPGPNWSDRNTRYFFTSDGGDSWTYLGTVSATRSGFPVIAITNDGRAVIGNHNTDGGGMLRAKWYVDLAPGVGVWRTLDPGGIGGIYPIWPNGIVTNNNKLIYTASNYRATCTIDPPMQFSGYVLENEMSSSSLSAIGVSNNGKIGLTYIAAESSPFPEGTVRFKESTDDGLTFGAPVTVWMPNYTTDSMAALRGIDMGYSGSVPNIVFEVCKRGIGSFYPKSMSKIMFWSPAVNNGNAIAIDSAGGLTGSNPTNDVFVSVCRPVMGKPYNFQNGIYLAYCKARQDTSNIGNNFFDIYFTCSGDGGYSWSSKERVTNYSLPIKDCRYVSISNMNYMAGGNNPYAHLIFQMDSIPGSSINGAPQSIAKMMYARLSGFNCPFSIGIINSNNEIPKEFILKQNYPNPFNSETQIEFGLPVQSYARIILYNIVGEKISELVSQRLGAGIYKVSWDASNQPSGVYFYFLETENYSVTRKMILIK